MAQYAIYSGAKEYARAMPGTEHGFRGVDLSSNPANVSRDRFAWLQNMYRDYHSESGIATEMIPGYRKIFTAEEAGDPLHINGLYKLKTVGGVDYIVIHAGTKIKLAKHTARDNISQEVIEATGEIADAKSRAFTYNGSLYILDGTGYYKVDTVLTAGEIASASVVSVADVAYIPTTDYYGEQYEQRNMLTNKYRAAFSLSNVKPYTNMFQKLLTVDGHGNFEVDKNVPELFSNTWLSSQEKKDFFFKNSDFSANETHGSDPSEVSLYNGNVESLCFICEDGSDYTIPSIGNGVVGGTYDDVTSYEGTGSYPNLKNISFSVKNGSSITFGGKIGDYSKKYTVKMDISEEEVEDALNGISFLPPNVVFSEAGDYKNTMLDIDADDFTVLANSDGLSIDSTLYEDIDDTPVGLGVYKIRKNGHNYIFLKSGSVIGDQYAVIQFNVGEKTKTAFFRILQKNVDDESVVVESEYNFNENVEPVTATLPQISTSVESVTSNGVSIPFSANKGIDGKVYSLLLIGVGAGTEINISATAAGYSFTTVGQYSDYAKGNPGYLGTSIEAISKCRICEIFDDRIFLSGNPDLPNTVFYSQRNDAGVTDPTYFGVLNYFNDGGDGDHINGLLAAGTTLLVLKGETIYYHQAAETGNDIIPKVYPSAKGVSGVGGVGATCNFLDDPVFLTKRGLDGISKETLTLERTVGHRSKFIDPELLKEDLASAEIAEWDGYLCIFAGGHVYMADSRQMIADEYGNGEYEWYYLCDIGDTHNFIRYHSVTGLANLGNDENPHYVENSETYFVMIGGELVPIAPFASDEENFDPDHVYTEMVVYSSEVNAFEDIGRVSVYYDASNGVAYLAEMFKEKVRGDEFDPAHSPCVIDDVLYFAANNNVYCFNTDKRGVPYNHFADIGKEGDNEDDYIEYVAPDKIHRHWYSFDGVRINARAVFVKDDCGVPYFNKTTVKNSLVMRAKVLDSGSFLFKVITDSIPKWRDVEKTANTGINYFDGQFCNTSFSAMDDSVFTIHEREKKWFEKQYCIVDGGFERPFGFYGMAYRYFISGGIKK